jgi:hypothetical protein
MRIISVDEGRDSARTKRTEGAEIRRVRLTAYGFPVICFKARVPTVKTEASISCRLQQYTKYERYSHSLSHQTWNHYISSSSHITNAR